jgi:hypothetical protein
MAQFPLDVIEARAATKGFNPRTLIVTCRNDFEAGPKTGEKCGAPIIWQSIQKRDGDRINLPFDFAVILNEDSTKLLQVKMDAHDCPARNPKGAATVAEDAATEEVKDEAKV